MAGSGETDHSALPQNNEQYVKAWQINTVLESSYRGLVLASYLLNKLDSKFHGHGIRRIARINVDIS